MTEGEWQVYDRSRSNVVLGGVGGVVYAAIGFALFVLVGGGAFPALVALAMPLALLAVLAARSTGSRRGVATFVVTSVVCFCLIGFVLLVAVFDVGNAGN